MQHRCSFCGRDTVTAGPLVQSPDKRAYICRDCSEIAQQLITTHQAPGMSPLGLAAIGALVVAGILFGLLYMIKVSAGTW